MSDLMLKLVVALQTLRAREEGQGMVEYGLILAVVAVIALTAFKTLGTNVNNMVNSLATTIGPYPQS